MIDEIAHQYNAITINMHTMSSRILKFLKRTSTLVRKMQVGRMIPMTLDQWVAIGSRHLCVLPRHNVR